MSDVEKIGTHEENQQPSNPATGLTKSPALSFPSGITNYTMRGIVIQKLAKCNILLLQETKIVAFC